MCYPSATAAGYGVRWYTCTDTRGGHGQHTRGDTSAGPIFTAQLTLMQYSAFSLVVQCMSVCLCVCHKLVILCIRSQSYRNSFPIFWGGGATRPSTNFFSYLNEIRYVGLVCALYTMVWRMTRSKVKIKVKVTEVRKLQNWLIPKSIASAGMHVQGRIQGRGLAPGPYQPTLICDGIFGCFAIFFFKNIKI